ncbi:hypothetical protein KUCAC02_012449 [Chaenocephalus aceratus]|uniref:Uncharacterized protein n=1 Tax=Chaenocephalus aceratus TaxID=36190 RepID=A0ACB9XAL2_CHAAC|nr:hypothetical protein KUCAC02_012449 [Chaenocephalus aceratus]
MEPGPGGAPTTFDIREIPSASGGPSRGQSERSRLLDLLIGSRKRSSSCFGARMDRIGNASSLGCNNGRGEAAVRRGN